MQINRVKFTTSYDLYTGLGDTGAIFYLREAKIQGRRTQLYHISDRYTSRKTPCW